MAKASYHIVSGDESEIHDEPHIEGSRITVRQIRELVEGEGIDPKGVADRYDLDLADVYHALAYYHAHPQEMSRVERERRRRVDANRENAITGPEDPA